MKKKRKKRKNVKKKVPVEMRAEMKMIAENLDFPDCEVTIVCGGCSLLATGSFELGMPPEQAKLHVAAQLHSYGWRLLDAPAFSTCDFFCPQCIEQEVPTKGFPE